MGILILGNGRILKLTGKGSTYAQMEIVMKGNGLTVSNMDKGQISSSLEILTWARIRMENPTVKEPTSGGTARSTMETFSLV